jgi:predicted Zn-dependent protease
MNVIISSRQRALALLLSLTTATAPLAWAGDLPDLGDESQVAVSPLLEKKAGESVMNDIRLHDASYLDDAEVSAYLGQLGRRLAAASGDPTYGFTFFAMRDAQINAFATYGGYVGVNTGLIIAAQSESELASVLAHEVSHVTQHHLARGISKQKQSSVATMAAMALALLAARSNSQVSTAAVVSAQAASVQSQISFTREFEREADRIGFDTLTKAGFDVHGMAAFFTRLQKETRLYENNAPAYLRTHPLTGERISDMQNRAADLPYKQVPDSLEFTLVRAKLRAEVGSPREAVIDFEAQLKDKKYATEAGARYGYARALLRDKQFDAAERELKNLRQLKVASPMLDKLAADIAVGRNNYAAAESIYRDALKRDPFNAAMIYGLADTLIAAKRWPQAQTFVNGALQEHSQDFRLYAFKARIANSLGQRFQEHRAQAEVYALQGLTQAAIEQLGLAQRAGDGSFYELSAADARLRDLKARLVEEKREDKQQ